MTAKVASVLVAGGVDPFRQGPGFALVGLVTGLVKLAEREYRRIHFLPSVAAALRAELANALELYLLLEAPYARYGVITTGQRCQVSEVRDRVVRLDRKVSRWHHEICGPLGIEALFRGVELPCDDAETFHVHANVIYQPTRHLRPREWRRFLRQTRAHFGAHWKDNGRLEGVREAIKYVMKGDEVLRLAVSHPAGLVQLYHQLKGLHLVQPLGAFRAWRHALTEANQKIVAIHECGGRKLVAVQFPPPRPRDDTEPSPGARLPQTNRLLCTCLPRALFSPWKEPVALIQNLDVRSLSQDPVLMEHVRKAVHHWTAKGIAPPPRCPLLARGAFTVHTSTTTVRAA
ncbi:MAG: hypothetical protein FVQ78_10815, partial [Solirubrobacterales bacterium]|nr:hypothetical protein [Solirubrobacterales bacterium]